MLGRICRAAVTPILAVLVVAAGATAATTPNVAALTLQVSDIPGAKTASARADKPDGYVAGYRRTLTTTKPYGPSRLVLVNSAVAVAASTSRPKADVTQVQALLRTKAGRTQVANGIARDYKVKPAAVTVGAMRGVAGYDQGFELPVGVKTKTGRVYESLTVVRLDRVLVVLDEVGARPIARGDTGKLSSLIAGRIRTALTPANVAVPTVTGTPQQGQTLTASPGTWSVDDAAFTYQWERCDGAGANCASVAGATQSTYAVSAADVGFTLRVTVTATNRFGANGASSAATTPAS